MNKYGTVSVVIPTYNSKYPSLYRSISSVLSQSLRPDEIIVIDDCSTYPFNGLDLLFSEEKITWINNSENRGVAYTRNRGVAECHSSIVAFLDAGDWWSVEKLKQQLPRLCSHGYRWAYCSSLEYIDENLRIENIATLPQEPKTEILKRNFITGSASSVIIEKDFFNEVGGFDTDPFIIEDWDLWIRMIKYSNPAVIPTPLTHIDSMASGSRSQSVGPKIERLKGTRSKYNEDIKHQGLSSFWDCKELMIEGNLLALNKQPIHALKIYLSISKINLRNVPWGRILALILALPNPSLYKKNVAILNKARSLFTYLNPKRYK